MKRLELLASLAREIREVIPGTKSVAIYSSGDMLVQVSGDDDVRAFAAECGTEVRAVDGDTSRWIDASVVIDGTEIEVMGPHREVEQPAEVSL